MSEVRDTTREVRLREVEDPDIEVFFEHQADPEGMAMAAFPARDKDQFAAHWAKIRADDTTIQRTIVADGAVAGYIGCWEQDGQHLLGYWIGREVWGRGVASAALRQFVGELSPGRCTLTSRCTTWARSGSWRRLASGAITRRARRRRHPTTASGS